jgi:hypothetical protein
MSSRRLPLKQWRRLNAHKNRLMLQDWQKPKVTEFWFEMPRDPGLVREPRPELPTPIAEARKGGSVAVEVEPVVTRSADSWVIELTRDEIERALREAELRADNVISRGCSDRLGRVRRSREEIVRDGHGPCCAELAASILTGMPWTSERTGPGARADIGEATEVRSSKFPWSPLRIYSFDKADHFFVLVTGQIPLYRVVGWMPGREARRAEFWRADLQPPQWQVPQESLRPMWKRPRHDACES